MEEEIRKQYEIETGKKWFTVPFTHGEQAFASWGYQLWLEKKISQVEPEVKPEICVNTDKLNGSGEYYYNAKLSELFTLNNLIPQLETKVDFVEGEELAQYEVSQIYYIAKERIAINIYLNEY